MDKEKLIKRNANKIFRLLGIMQLLFLMLIISSPFVGIWYSWSLALKLGLTGFFGALVVNRIYSFIKKCISEAIEEVIKKQNPETYKSKFQRKMEEMQEKSKAQKKL